MDRLESDHQTNPVLPDSEPDVPAVDLNRNSNTRPRSESDFSRRLIPTPNAPLGKKIAEELHQRFPKRSSEKLTVVADLFTKLTATDQPADLIEKKIKDKRQQIDKLVGQIKEKRSALVKTYSTEAPSFSGKPSPEVETSIKEFGKKQRGLIDDDAFEFKKTVDLFKGLQNKAYKKGHNFGSKGIISQLYDCFDKKSVKQALDDKDIGEKFEELFELTEEIAEGNRWGDSWDPEWDLEIDSWEVIQDRIKPLVRLLKLRDAFGTLQKALEAGETPSKALADIERGLQETFASLSIQNVVSEKIPYGVEFVGGFAELGKSLSKLRCEINLAELKQSLASFPEASPKPRNLFDELLEDFSDQNVETTIKGLEDLKATLSAKGMDTGKSENKIDELTDNVRLMSLNHKVAECERQRIRLNQEYIEALRPRTKVDLDKLRALTARFPQTNETILAVVFASNPNIDIEELVALRNLFPEKSIEDLANLLDSVGLSAIQSFKQHLPDVKFLEMQQLLLEYPKLNAAKAAEVQGVFSDESLSNIAKMLKIDPDFNATVARNTYPDDNLDQIYERMQERRRRDAQDAPLQVFPQLDLNNIARQMRAVPQWDIDRARELGAHFQRNDRRRELWDGLQNDRLRELLDRPQNDRVRELEAAIDAGVMDELDALLQADPAENVERPPQNRGADLRRDLDRPQQVGDHLRAVPELDIDRALELRGHFPNVDRLREQEAAIDAGVMDEIDALPQADPAENVERPPL